VGQLWLVSNQGGVTITVGNGTTTSAGVFANLQSDSRWNGYTLMPPYYNICGACTPSGPAITYSTQQGISVPSLSGRSMRFSIGGTMPYGDVLWNQKFTSRLSDPSSVPNYHDFTYDKRNGEIILAARRGRKEAWSKDASR
jgi:hypothetical protein